MYNEKIMPIQSAHSPIVLVILDGWGQKSSTAANAIAAAKTPHWDQLLKTTPATTLSASGLDVGLPDNQMGNSEVGHLTIGAGRVLPQDLTRINSAIADQSFQTNPVLVQVLEKLKQTGKALHIMGLLSPGGVHSHEAHLQAMVKLAADKGVATILVHAFLDGRDTPPQSAMNSLQDMENLCKTHQANLVSLSGRYYAMDRDKRWDRTQQVYDLLTQGKTQYTADSFEKALNAAYERGETDEFVTPTQLEHFTPIKDGDAVVFMNFRSDRARQLSAAFCDPSFSGFQRQILPQLCAFATLTEYDPELNASVAFPNPTPKNLLGEFLEHQALTQCRIAETEKYAHVTFFLNGGKEVLFKGEERILVPSKKVATYDLCPEMSAQEVTDALIQALPNFDVIIVNYANADMVGHTGNFTATVKAIEILDTCLGNLIQAIQSTGGELVITADHGNAETMFDEQNQQPLTSHTLERVPFVYVGRPATITYHSGTLSDIAPTVLYLLGLNPPPEMTGKVLLSLS